MYVLGSHSSVKFKTKLFVQFVITGTTKQLNLTALMCLPYYNIAKLTSKTMVQTFNINHNCVVNETSMHTVTWQATDNHMLGNSSNKGSYTVLHTNAPSPWFAFFRLLFTETYNLNQTFFFLYMHLLSPEMCILFDMKQSAFVCFLGALQLLYLFWC